MFLYLWELVRVIFRAVTMAAEEALSDLSRLTRRARLIMERERFEARDIRPVLLEEWSRALLQCRLPDAFNSLWHGEHVFPGRDV